jgi:hypothetical protein
MFYPGCGMRRPAKKPTDRDLQVLKTLADAPAVLTRRELAASSGVPEGTVASCLSRLRRFGLVSWVEGRARTLAVAPVGHQALQKGRP